MSFNNSLLLEMRTTSVACSGMPLCPSSVRKTDSVFPEKFHLNGRRVPDDQGAVAQHVRANGRNNEGLDSWMHDGATCREGIGRRARWTCNDQAVGTVAADKVAVNAELPVRSCGPAHLC